MKNLRFGRSSSINKNRARHAVALLVSFVLMASLLSGCMGASNGGSTEEEDAAQAAAQREALVIESKLNRYFERIIDDYLSLETFLNQMPKGADLRVLTSHIVAPSKVNAEELPVSEAEYRSILAQAITQRVGYLEVVANLTPAQIEELDSIQRQVSRELTTVDTHVDVTVNFLVAVTSDGDIEEFTRELEAALELFKASDRIVGVVVLPATTARGSALFSEQIEAINQACKDAGFAFYSESSQSSPRFSISTDTSSRAYVEFEDLVGRVTIALSSGYTTRLEYGTSISYELDAYNLLKELANNEVGVLVSPLSLEGSSDSLAIDVSAYRLYSSAGVGVAVASSSADGTNSSLGEAYARLAFANSMTYKEVKTLAYNALEAAFLSAEEHEAQVKNLDEAFQAFEKNMSQTIDDLGLLK